MRTTTLITMAAMLALTLAGPVGCGPDKATSARKSSTTSRMKAPPKKQKVRKSSTQGRVKVYRGGIKPEDVKGRYVDVTVIEVPLMQAAEIDRICAKWAEQIAGDIVYIREMSRNKSTIFLNVTAYRTHK